MLTDSSSTEAAMPEAETEACSEAVRAELAASCSSLAAVATCADDDETPRTRLRMLSAIWLNAVAMACTSLRLPGSAPCTTARKSPWLMRSTSSTICPSERKRELTSKYTKVANTRAATILTTISRLRRAWLSSRYSSSQLPVPTVHPHA